MKITFIDDNCYVNAKNSITFIFLRWWNQKVYYRALRMFFSSYQANEVVFIILIIKYQVRLNLRIDANVLELRKLGDHFVNFVFPPSLYFQMLDFLIRLLGVLMVAQRQLARKLIVRIDVNLFVADTDHDMLYFFAVIWHVIIIYYYIIRFFTWLVSV